MGSANHHQGGFTLLEVLVAIGIFSVVAIVSYTTLDTYIDQRERLTSHYGRLERLQRLFILLERDIQFSVGRTVRVGGEVQPATVIKQDSILLALTVAQADLHNASGISLKRVEWELDGNELLRSQWNVLDHNGDIEPSRLLVSDELADIELSYLIYSSNRGLETSDNLDSGQTPAGIELNVTLNSGSSYRRVFAVARDG
jgi:general secretion pathway protein J